MSDFAPLWTREAHRPTDRQADMLLVCFSKGPLNDDPPLQADRFGVPSRESVDALDVRRQERKTNVNIFEGWRTDPLRTIAQRDLGDEGLALLDSADECHLVRAQLQDPADLGHVQAAWAVARWMCARGATIVLDGHAARFWRGATLATATAGEAFEVGREISFVLETEPTFGPDGHYVHTRGLIKVARPDIVAVCSLEDSDVVVEIMKELSAGMVRGLLPNTTREGVSLGKDLSLFLGDPTPEVDVARLHLNNDATLLSLEHGAHLIGVVKKLREMGDS